MRRYSTGDVERIAGVKAHLLRYWEEAGWLPEPARSASGRREYSERELLDVMRFRHFVHDLGMPLEAARDALREEAISFQDEKAFANEARAGLLEALEAIQALSAHLDSFKRTATRTPD